MEEFIRTYLGDICNLSYGKNLSTSLFKGEGYDVFGANGIIGKYNYYTHENEEVLVSSRGENSGVINFSNPRSYITNNSIVCDLKKNINKRFLYYSLKTVPRKSFVSGSAQPQVVIHDLKKISILIPTSPIEQTHIANILSTADEAIALTEQLIAKYQRIKTGLMQDLLTKGIDAHGNIRNKATHKFVVKNGVEVPEEWEVQKLKDTCKKIGDGVHSSVNFQAGEEVPFLFVSCIREGYILWENSTQISNLEFERIGVKVDNEPIVLYSVVGSYGNAVKLTSNIKVAFQRHIAYVIPIKDKIDADFVEVFLNSQLGKKQADFYAIGNAQKTITLGALKEISICVPTLAEQSRILKMLSAKEILIKEYQHNLQKLHSLKTGLMQDLLSGRVRVKM